MDSYEKQVLGRLKNKLEHAKKELKKATPYRKSKLEGRIAKFEKLINEMEPKKSVKKSAAKKK